AEESSGKLQDYKNSIKEEKSGLKKRKYVADKSKKDILNSKVRRTKRNCNVRQKASGKSSKMGKVKKSQKYRVTSAGKYWYKIVNGKFGGNYISKKCF
ncbi:hypothetical protein N9W41_00725, partial [bacterium]|nr:hypothetical protein [bacterium]